MTAAGPPGRGWYADPLGSGGRRWWDGAEWAYAVDMRPPGRRLPVWAKISLGVGITICVANLAVLTLGLLLSMLSEAAARDFYRILDLWGCAALSLVIASVAAAARGETRVRIGALIVAVAIVAGSWTWYRTTLPPRPGATKSQSVVLPAFRPAAT